MTTVLRLGRERRCFITQMSDVRVCLFAIGHGYNNSHLGLESPSKGAAETRERTVNLNFQAPTSDKI